MNKEVLDLAMRVLGSAEEIKPLARAALKLFDDYGDEIKEAGDLIRRLLLHNADVNAEIFRRYTETHNFTREEALLLVIDSSAARKPALSSLRSSNQSK